MSEFILETNGLTKSFGRKKAVDNVSIHIEKGAVYGFIGRNGAGKTTLMKIVSGLSNQSSGTFSLFGTEELYKVRGKVGCLIEAPGLYPDMTAFQNLKMKCLSAGKSDDKFIESLLETVGLGNVGKKKAKNFSLGMKQRLGIAIALIGDPELMILDEPINGLDPQGIVEVRETIHRLNTEKGITILISSHILEELSKIATHYGIIHNGQLLMELSAEELNLKCSNSIEIVTPDTERACEVLKNSGIESKVLSNGHISVTQQIEDSAEITKMLVQSDIAVSEIFRKGQELEDFYMDITGGGKND